MAAGIPSGFVRKLYRILDLESDSIISWDASGDSFSIHDAKQLNDVILPRYFRGRLCAFRQQLIDHGFKQLECEDDESRETYAHVDFVRGCPERLGRIVRRPKGKKATTIAAVTTPSAQISARTATRVSPPSILTAPRGGSSALTVTLSTSKRPSPDHRGGPGRVLQPQKRLRATSGISPPPPTTTLPAPPAHPLLSNGALGSVFNGHGPVMPSKKNPLFSDDPDTSGLDVARIFSLGRISDTGVLPCSTDLPEPISYLTKALHAQENAEAAASTASQVSTQSTSSSTSSIATASPSVNGTLFPEDLMKSALYFLVSSSTTGLETPSEQPVNSAGATSARDPNSLEARAERLSTSTILSSLLVSSTNGTSANGAGAGAGSSPSQALSAWASSSNPLFSQSVDEEDDSIWSLLVASSIDRVKTAMTELSTPQERLRVILQEREQLEEQRKKIFDSATPPEKLGTAMKQGQTTERRTLKGVLKKPTIGVNPLFASEAKTPSISVSANPLFAAKSRPAPSPTNPLFTKKSAISPSASGSRNPLFTKDSETGATLGASNPLFAKKTVNSLLAKPGIKLSTLKSEADTAGDSTTAVSHSRDAAQRPPSSTTSGGAAVVPSEDGLWRLLMSSSVDWLRKSAAEMDV
ncbi:hypothetical protein PINS_up000690 [Pythium insidiosum]|nr:hypothetical protein PINS_up000690 [Pythium insidiosum]